MGNVGHSATKDRADSDTSHGTGKGVGKGKIGKKEVETVGQGRCLPLPGRASKPPQTTTDPPISAALRPASGDTPAHFESDVFTVGSESHVGWGSGWTSQCSSPSKQAPPPPPPEPAPWSRADGNTHAHYFQPTSPPETTSRPSSPPRDHGQNWWGNDYMQQQWGGVPNGLLPPPTLPAPSLGLPSMPISQAQREAEAELQRKDIQITAVTQQIQAAQAELQQLRWQQQAADDSARSQAGRAVAAARIQQARELVASTKPELESMKENLAKSLTVVHKLDAWFVENAEKMNIQDPRSTPSAYLSKLLESCDRRLEILSTGITHTMSGGVAHGTVATLPQQSTTQVSVQPYMSLHGQGQSVQGSQNVSQPGVQPHSVTAGYQPQQQLQLQPQQSVQGSQNGSQPGVQPYSATVGYQPQQQLQLQPQPLGSRTGVTQEASQPGGVGVAGMWVRDPDAT